MADALLARLANGHANPTIELSSAPPVAIPPAPQVLQRELGSLPTMPDLRPSSVVRSEVFFGKEGQNQLLDYHRRANAQASSLRGAATRANRIRHLLTIIMVLAGVTSSVLSGAPLCAEGDGSCSTVTKNIASAMSALSVALMGVLEKTQSRKDAIRLRDLSSDYERLAALLDRRLFTAPPENVTPGAFIKQVSASFEALEGRHTTLRPQPAEVVQATHQYDRQLQQRNFC